MSIPSYRPPAPNGPGTCPRCCAPVIWTITTKNRVSQAVDTHRDPRGNQAIRQTVTGRWISRQLTKDRPAPEHDETLHMPHRITCTSPPPAPAPRPRLPRERRGTRPIQGQGWRR